ncbi:hypothetical protein HS088_TW03G00516 [Tripterygium wilfordii]|uniref:Uncharacterized protein n=1 Tax=Tripterygium wilfordii TaxID=458696 RepID=A0A7J7DV53_TRIWF|nr:uncharacterized protein LOC119991396 [Tripterygium wilfordii]KAF5750183.1 hypothetical protein HS088_TW03G00516 [Tripterygium wilfordii]
MGSSLINQESNHGVTMVEADLDSISFSSSSSEEEEEEEINSSVSFHDMSNLLQHLPFKRGLSRHYQGKSQSFTSLLSVKCIEDLAKPENPCKKKIKSSKSYGGLLLVSEEDDQNNNSSYPPPPPAAVLPHKVSSLSSARASCSSLVSANKMTGGRPPIPHPQRSTTTSGLIF